jgi:probable F420-dependent oxidoreductase
MTDEQIQQAAALRERIGRVGVWSGDIGRSCAAREQEVAAELEALGYGALWYPETPAGKEALVHASLLLQGTTGLVVASGIANVYARDAHAASNGADALNEAFDGRFVLGLGISHAPAVALRGSSYGKPVTTMRAYLDRMAEGTYEPPPPAAPTPVVLAALRTRMLELARDRTLGAHPYFTPVEHTAHARATLGPEPVLAPEIMVILDTDADRARARARKTTARYLTLPNYVDNLREYGFDDADFSGGGSDRLVDAIVGHGDVGAIAARVRAHHEAGADHVAVQALSDDVDGQLAALRELAPALLSG